MRTSTSLMVLLLVVAPVQAQEGPSFDCRFAGTATELAICRSPDLARLERRLVQSYEGLAERIGQADARATADGYLALRQACEGETGCIEAQLVAATQAFESGGTAATPGLDEASTSVAAVASALRDRETGLEAGASIDGAPTGLDEVLRPRRRPSGDARPQTESANGLPSLRSDPALLARPEGIEGGGDPTPALPGEEPGAIVAATTDLGSGSDAAPESTALPPSVLTGAFLALPANSRVNLQGRLVEAGFGRFDLDGTWTLATAAALATAAKESTQYGMTFNPSTREGAAALLDFIASVGFEQAFLGGAIASEPGP